MLMLLVAVTTWAQVTPTTGKWYRIQNVETGFYLKSTRYNSQGDGALQVNTEAQEEAQYFSLEAANEGTYYLKQNVKTVDYFVYNTGSWNSGLYDNDHNKKTEYQVILNDEEAKVYELKRTSDNKNLGTDSGDAGASVYADKSINNNGKWQFIEVSDEELAVVKKVPVYVNAIADLANNNIYAIHNADGRGSWVSNGEAITSTVSASVAVNEKSPEQQFAILKSSKDKYYLYSISAAKFVKKNGDYTAFTDAPEQSIELLECGTPGKWVIALVDANNSKYHMGISNGYNPALITFWNDTNDGGNQSQIEIIGTDFDATEILSKLNECTITYNFTFGGKTIYSQTSTGIVNADYPTISKELPFGTTAQVPAGKVSGDETVNIELTIEKEVPFKVAASINDIDTWYYAQMHVFNDSYKKFIQPKDDNGIEWNDLTFGADEIDSHLWAFVGDRCNLQIINKAEAKAIVSTGGDAQMGDAANATAFIVFPSDNKNSEDYFCLRYPGQNDNFLNATGGKVAAWDDNDNGSTMFVTEYKEFTTSISSLKYATLYLDYASFIPEGVTANAVTSIDGVYAKFTAFEGAIPAEQGAILNGEEGTYTFKRAPQATAVEGNMLLGTTTNENIEGPAYVLSAPEGKVGLYKAALTDGTFFNNANKAYMPAPAEAQNAAFFSFDFDWNGTTGIENIEGATEENNAVKGIYDLTGRKVETITAPGIYIINGKKMLVK